MQHRSRFVLAMSSLLALVFVAGLSVAFVQVRASSAPAMFPAGTLLFSKPTGFFLESKKVSSTGQPVYYGATDPGANWAIAQWANPGGDLPNFSLQAVLGSTTAYQSQSGAAAARVVKSGAEATLFDLSQDGGSLPCDVPGTVNNPQEFDMFGGETDQAKIPGVSAGNGAPLSQLSALQLGTAARITNLWNDTPQGKCKVNQRGADIALVLNNYGDATHPSQTLFYQIGLYSTRCTSGNTNAVCNAQNATSTVSYFWANGSGSQASKDSTGKITHQNFGYNDDVAVFGVSDIRPSQFKAFSVDVLPHLKDILAKNINGLDPDPTHWYVNAMYQGTMIWGGVGISTRWVPLVVSNGPVPILGIASESPTVAAGGKTTLYWATAAVTSCAVSGPGVQSTALNGSQTVGPFTTPTTYTLTCQSPAGPQTRTATIGITGA